MTSAKIDSNTLLYIMHKNWHNGQQCHAALHTCYSSTQWIVQLTKEECDVSKVHNCIMILVSQISSLWKFISSDCDVS